ncbi:hypothetical protein PBY51_019693 [Eleginops maclovinus]|uniref:Immunoglobulin domain-containing protein n=1 Tax=Eleginops maclovinus TaxID=56733 RepID=A0AAN8AJZ4_ELEMC|nr:hypothetical protein PBY51_019693 [Eleginops maclovinus]
MGAPLPATTQRIQAVEGQDATVRCRFNRPDSFIARVVETSVNITDLTRGILSVTIFSVTRSDSGIYTAFAVDEFTGDEFTCSAELIVEPKDPQTGTKRNPSSPSAPPPEGDPDAAENRNDVWKIVLPCVLILAVIAVAVIVILVKRGVMNRICKKGGEPVENGDELKERRRSGTPEPQWGVKISRVLQKKA